MSSRGYHQVHFTQVGLTTLPAAEIERRIQTGKTAFEITDLTFGNIPPSLFGITPTSVCTFPGCHTGRCKGHFGWYRMKCPVPNPVYIRQILDVLSEYCVWCSAPRSKEVSKKCHIKKHKVEYDLGKLVWTQTSTDKKNASLAEKTRSVGPEGWAEIIDQMCVETERSLRFASFAGLQPSLRDLFLWFLPQVPSFMRQGSHADDNDKSHSFITKLLNSAIGWGISVNNRISSDPVKQEGQPDRSTLPNAMHFLYSSLRLAFLRSQEADFTTTGRGLKLGHLPAHGSFTPLMAAFSGKTGLIRGQMLGKTQHYSRRSVIVPDLTINIGQFRMPPQSKTQMGINGEFRSELAQSNFYRNPSLTASSFQGGEDVYGDTQTIGMKPSITPGLNADFDGDEGNGVVPQTIRALVENATLMWSAENIIAPGGQLVIYPIQDSITGMFVVMRDNPTITVAAAKVILVTGAFDASETFRSFRKRMKLPSRSKVIEARLVLSACLPKAFSMPGLVHDGVFLLGATYTKKEMHKLLRYLRVIYGDIECAHFIDVFERCVSDINHIIGITVTYNDMFADEETSQQFSAEAAAGYRAAVLEDDPRLSSIISSSTTEGIQIRAREVIAARGRNGMLDIIQSKAKGSEVHLYQIYCSLGEQKRYHSLLPGQQRRAVCIDKDAEGALDLQNMGFIEQSFGDGLTQLQAFLHAEASRPGLVASSTSLSVDGDAASSMNKFSENLVNTDRHKTLQRFGMIVSTNVGQYNVASNQKDFLELMITPEGSDAVLRQICTSLVKGDSEHSGLQKSSERRAWKRAESLRPRKTPQRRRSKILPPV